MIVSMQLDELSLGHRSSSLQLALWLVLVVPHIQAAIMCAVVLPSG